MFITRESESVRFTGRWADDASGAAVTTAPGAMVEFAYTGKTAVLCFELEWMQAPVPHLWISVDGGARVEMPVDRYHRIEAADEGNHYVKVVFKSAVEMHHRWYQPLIGKVAFRGVEADGEGSLPADNRKTIEFIGDSITEGVLIDAFRAPNSDNDQLNRPYQDDSTATYAYLTATALNLKPIIMGYGAVGITKSGCGSVPRVGLSYPYYYEGMPAEAAQADITVINHGANDAGNITDYIPGYYEFLKLVRSRNPETRIVVLGAFCGFAVKELEEMVAQFNVQEKDSVTYISTQGWIPKEPLHPLRDGHSTVAEHLTEELKRRFSDIL